MNTYEVIEQISARPSSDGDGVKLLRVFGGARPERFDPFLLMDEFGSDEASDYVGGFPPHPHRGFSTITYMLQGKMEHRDHMDNVGLLHDGDVQWMTAGKGVIHSEMPKQTEGKMRGFQIWLNLAAEDKLQAADYEDVPGNNIPVYDVEDIHVKAIAGNAMLNGNAITGYFQVAKTQPVYWDIHLAPGAQASIEITDKLNAMAYVYQGEVSLGGKKVISKLNTLSRLDITSDSTNHHVLIKNHAQGESRVILLAGKPLEEPIAQYGPFVMNNMEEIDQALHDYREGILTH